MIQNIEKMKSPPLVGETYLVPCVTGQIALLGQWQVKGRELWPVLRPSHQDSVYVIQTRSIWKPHRKGTVLIDEEYYEDDPTTPHHFHVDPRFAPAEFYTGWEVVNNNLHNVIDIQSDVQWREMVCLREMPPQRLFTGFGQRFVDEHKGKKAKCARCPHRGALLNSMPVVDGVITCPNHGLKFDANTMKCITEDSI